VSNNRTWIPNFIGFARYVRQRVSSDQNMHASTRVRGSAGSVNPDVKKTPCLKGTQRNSRQLKPPAACAGQSRAIVCARLVPARAFACAVKRETGSAATRPACAVPATVSGLWTSVRACHSTPLSASGSREGEWHEVVSPDTGQRKGRPSLFAERRIRGGRNLVPERDRPRARDAPSLRMTCGIA
jgi:hypothetical protein